jgi:OFA family oxalate/formate antiporter-like MFS transporter
VIDRSARAELSSGWPVLVACAIGVGCSAVALPFYSIGPLTKPIAAATGWTRSEIQFAIVFSSGIGALASPFVGWLIERFGPRRVALPSLLGVAAGLLVASFATSLHMFWAGYALSAILGAGSNPVLWSRVVAGSFDRARGTALGLALVGTAFVAMLLPNLVAAVEPLYGWRTALRVVSLLPVAIAFPVVFLLLHPRDAVSSRDGGSRLAGISAGEALRSPKFWILTLSILGGYLAISGAGPNLIPAFTDRGLDARLAAAVASTYAISMIPGRICAGMLMDRFWAPAVACTVLLLPAIACLILSHSSSVPLLVLACALLGLAAGAELDVLAFLTARYFGLLHYPKIYAMSYVALAAGSATAPTIFSRLQQSTGNYATSFYVAASLFVLAGLLLLFLGRYPARHAVGTSNA